MVQEKIIKYSSKRFNIVLSTLFISGLLIGLSVGNQLADTRLEIFETYQLNNQTHLQYPAMFPNVTMQRDSYLFFDGYAIKAK